MGTSIDHHLAEFIGRQICVNFIIWQAKREKRRRDEELRKQNVQLFGNDSGTWGFTGERSRVRAKYDEGGSYQFATAKILSHPQKNLKSLEKFWFIFEAR